MRIYISAKYKFSYGYGLRRATTETRDRRAVRLLLLEDDPRGGRLIIIIISGLLRLDHRNEETRDAFLCRPSRLRLRTPN